MSSDSKTSLTRVQSSINGYVSVNANLKYCRNTNVVLRGDVERLEGNIVRIISGGGSGHEPAHLGYVGEGMLTAAVCGEVFASPSVSNILNAIVSVGRPGSSVLLIVKNYTGDRLNFGLAGEIAKTKYGYEIETLLVDDDCAIENVRKSVGKRGLAGTVLIHKIAGAMALKGLKLKQIHEFCDNLLKNGRLATVGFTFTEHANRFQDIEIGRGIHGEPGIHKYESDLNFDSIIESVIRPLLKKVPTGVPKPQVIVMLNNLGGTSALTMSTFSNLFLERARIEYDVCMILEGTFMTSLKQEGISATILHLLDQDRDKIIEYIEHPVKIGANVPFNIIRTFVVPDPMTTNISEYFLERISDDQRLHKAKHNDIEIAVARRVIQGVCNVLATNETLLNRMDAEFGDGDTGTLIATGTRSILEALNSNKIDFEHPTVMLHDLSEILQKNMGGSLGVLFSICLQAAAEAFVIDDEPTRQDRIHSWLLAMKLGTSAVKKYGLAEIGDRTMIDALQCGVVMLERRIEENASFHAMIDDLALACEDGANKTKEMVPKSGRAAYAFSEGKEFSATQSDPGAQVVALIARECVEQIKSMSKKQDV